MTQTEQGQQGVRGIRLDQGETFHRPRHRHVQRIDVELVQLQRFIALVLGAFVLRLVVDLREAEHEQGGERHG